MLNKYPEIIIKKVTTAKKIPMSFKVITFFKSIASGSDKPTTPIIKAMAVPNGTPFATKTCITGITPAELLYIGIPKMTAIGTAKGFSLLI